MARPATNGCLYFPLDCNFYEDRNVRLLRSQFGTKSEAVLIRLWCLCYSNGYYCQMEEDDIALLAESMGSGFSANYIRDVIEESCRRGIFDKTIFAQFRVLTSKGIQTRYLSIRHSKKIIPAIKEYWVLDEAYLKGENEALLLKLQFFSILTGKTEVLAVKTPDLAGTTGTKEKEKKEDSAQRQAAAAPPVIELTLNKGSFPVSEAFYRQMCELYPAVNVMQELRNMQAWLLSNPKRRKTHSGVTRFINAWLAKEQDRGGYRPNGGNEQCLPKLPKLP